MQPPMDHAMDELRAAVRLELRMGFTPANEIVEMVLDLAEDEHRDQLRSAVEHLMNAESQAMRREQAGWPAVTDCDRLDGAFQELEERGIVARQHFSCCQTCGSTEIWGEVDDAEAAGMQVRGHTYYHAQDTESAAEGGGLYLAYGSVEEDGITEIGREVVAVLNAHGLATKWNGSPEERIGVSLDWKRRRDDL